MTTEIVITDSSEICLIKSYRIVRKNIRNACTWMMIQGLYIYGEVSTYLNGITNEYISTPESPVYTPPVRVCQESAAFVGPNVDEHVISASITHHTSGVSYDILDHLKSMGGYPTAGDVISSFEIDLDPEEHGVDIITSTGESRHFRNNDYVDEVDTSGDEGDNVDVRGDDVGTETGEDGDETSLAKRTGSHITKPDSDSSLEVSNSDSDVSI